MTQASGLNNHFVILSLVVPQQKNDFLKLHRKREEEAEWAGGRKGGKNHYVPKLYI